MILNTTKFGEVEVNEDYIFDFVEPILGYEDLKKFALVDYDNDSPFKWLQSIENLELALPVTIPAFFGINYQFTIPDEKVALLQAGNADDILSLNITNIPKGQPQEATVNLVAPIVVNINNKKAMQLVLSNTDFSVKHKLFASKE
ncbi:MAG: flagellar assembly protein FliW [Candidatus Gastranaerophilales bacterium]|nr:flagellar assembly protein FliW [Candidatus Gastranaerophilales bacterium]